VNSIAIRRILKNGVIKIEGQNDQSGRSPIPIGSQGGIKAVRVYFRDTREEGDRHIGFT
jgi:hypothetical protein